MGCINFLIISAFASVVLNNIKARVVDMQESSILSLYETCMATGGRQTCMGHTTSSCL